VISFFGMRREAPAVPGAVIRIAPWRELPLATPDIQSHSERLQRLGEKVEALRRFL
jgi:hypothetical protein